MSNFGTDQSSESLASPVGRKGSKPSPKTATYCYLLPFVAAKPLRLFQREFTRHRPATLFSYPVAKVYLPF